MYEHSWLTVHAVKFSLTKCAAASHVFAPANIYGLWGGVLELRMLKIMSMSFEKYAIVRYPICLFVFLDCTLDSALSKQCHVTWELHSKSFAFDLQQYHTNFVKTAQPDLSHCIFSVFFSRRARNFFPFVGKTQVFTFDDHPLYFC